MEKLIEIQQKLLKNTTLDFVRSIDTDIQWESRLIGIKGARGIGKTTLLLQHVKNNFPDDNSVLYASLDNLWFAENKVVDLADKFSKQGGTHLFLDEVHKYSDWSQELKNIYDNYPELKVVFTGSSLLEIIDAVADLSRRAVIYNMQGLSFREFLQLETGQSFEVIKLDDLLKRHQMISGEILKKIKPLKYFPKYLHSGYFPFYKEEGILFHQQLEAIINMTIGQELPLLRNIDIIYTNKIKQLLSIIARSAPFIPNISKLSGKIGINRQTLLLYLHYLMEGGMTKNLYRDNRGISLLQKPEKIFLENSNYSFAFSDSKPETGNIRETFFLNQLSHKHSVTYPDKADFLVDGKYSFEIGGSGKSNALKDIYIAADDIEYGFKNKIPLWLFGFLY